MSQPSLIHLIAVHGREDAINAIYKQEIGETFLIWSKAQIAERIRAVNAGQFESLSHLRGKLGSIDDWNRALPEMAEGHGSVLIADHEATLTPMHLLSLRKNVLFIELHKHEFQSIEGLETAQMLLGGAGRKGIGVVAPEEPQSGIYKLCVRYKALDLWAQFYRFRADPKKDTWSTLKRQIVPWRMSRSVEALIKALPNSSKAEIPTLLELRRALLPNNPSPEVKAALNEGVAQLKPKKRD